MIPVVPELHRPVTIDHIAGLTGSVVEVTASPEECAAIALRMSIPGVTAFTCRFELTRAQDGRAGEVVADGVLTCELIRECVVTLDDFPTRMRERFRVRFVPAGLESEDDDIDGDDEIAYAGVTIDLGEAAVEQLALSLDPYPRKPGAVIPKAYQADASGPFAALARILPLHDEREDGDEA